MSEYIPREAALEALCADCCAKECDKGLCQDYHNISVLPAAAIRECCAGDYEQCPWFKLVSQKWAEG